MAAPEKISSSILNRTISDAAADSGPGAACTVGTILGRLRPSDAEALRQLLAMPATICSNAAIAAGLSDVRVLEQYPALPAVRPHTVARHRRGRCACGKQARLLLGGGR